MEERGGGMAIEQWLAERDEPVEQRRLQRRVKKQLRRDPSLHDADLAVDVADDVVTLRGSVHSYLERSAAERVAGCVPGVRAVRNEVYVAVPASHTRTDADLTADVRRALACNVAVPADRVAVSVEGGCVVLVGEVDWDAQRQAAEDAVAGLEGVRRIVDELHVGGSLTSSENWSG